MNSITNGWIMYIPGRWILIIFNEQEDALLVPRKGKFRLSTL